MSEHERSNEGTCGKGCHCGEPSSAPKRKRGMTSVMLKWLADRVRKAELVKQKIDDGTYKVDNEQLARAIVKPERMG